MEDFGELIYGWQYMIALEDRVAVMVFEALEEVYDEIAEEFEAMVASFNFLP